MWRSRAVSIVLVVFAAVLFSQAIPATAQSSDFSLSASPGSRTVKPGQVASYTIAVSPIQGKPCIGLSWKVEGYAEGDFLGNFLPAQQQSLELFSSIGGKDGLEGTPLSQILCARVPFTATVDFGISTKAMPGIYTIVIVGEDPFVGGIKRQATLQLVVEKAAAETQTTKPSSSSLWTGTWRVTTAELEWCKIGSGSWTGTFTISDGKLSGNQDGISLWEGEIEGQAVENTLAFTSNNRISKISGGGPYSPADFSVEATISGNTLTGSFKDKCYLLSATGGVIEVREIRGSITGTKQSETTTGQVAPPTTPSPTTATQLPEGGKYTSLTYKGTITVDVSSGTRDSGVAQYTLSAKVSVPFEITLTPSKLGARDLTGKTKRFTVRYSGTYSYTKSDDYCRSPGQSGSGSLSGTLELYVEGKYHSDTNEVTFDIGVTSDSESPDPGICRDTGGLFLGGIGVLGDIGEYKTNQLKFKATGGTVPLSGRLSTWAPRSSYSGTAELTLVSYETEKQIKPTTPPVTPVPTPATTKFDYEVIVSPQSQKIEQGEDAKYAVTVKLKAGTPNSVALRLTTDPRMFPSFLPKSGLPTFNSQLTINTSCDTPPTLYAPQILGESAAYRLIKFDIVTLQVNPNPECAKSIGSVTKSKAGWDTGYDGFVEQPLGKRGRVIIGPRTQVRWFPTSEGTGFSVVKGKVHLTYKAEAAETPPGYEISASEIRGGGLPIGGMGITYGEYTAAIRGTEFLLEVADDGTGTLTVLEGTVEVWKTQEPEREVFVKDGQQLVTRPKEPLPEPVSADPATISALPQSGASISEIASATGTWWEKPPKGQWRIGGALILLAVIAIIAAGGAVIWRKTGKHIALPAIKRVSKKIQQPSFKFCHDCGARMSAGAEFCPNCGEKQLE